MVPEKNGQVFIVNPLIFFTLIQRMTRKRAKGTKYARVTKQQKYVFLKLCITEKQSIHQAAYNTGIHYSTAKTILFFHKRQYKNYTSYFVNDPQLDNQSKSMKQASYKGIPIDLQDNGSMRTEIQIIVNSIRSLKQCHRKKRVSRNRVFNESQSQPQVKIQEEISECHEKIQKEEQFSENQMQIQKITSKNGKYQLSYQENNERKQ